MTELTNEELRAEVVRRCKGMSSRRAVALLDMPISHQTLTNVKKPGYPISMETRRVLLKWLGASPAPDVDGYRAGLGLALKKLDAVREELRAALAATISAEDDLAEEAAVMGPDEGAEGVS